MSTNSQTITRTRVSLKTPSMWKVVLHNDDYTPIDFVVALLCEVFNKSVNDAFHIAQNVHMSGKNGKAQVGLYTKEIALDKVALCERICREKGHPLKATAEEA